MSIESVMPSNHLILCHTLLLLPSIFPSIRGFSNELALGIRWSKYWSFSFSISPSNECSGLISFRMDWFDLLEVPGTLQSLLQHHSSKESYTFNKKHEITSPQCRILLKAIPYLLHESDPCWVKNLGSMFKPQMHSLGPSDLGELLNCPMPWFLNL